MQLEFNMGPVPNTGPGMSPNQSLGTRKLASVRHAAWHAPQHSIGRGGVVNQSISNALFMPRAKKKVNVMSLDRTDTESAGNVG